MRFAVPATVVLVALTTLTACRPKKGSHDDEGGAPVALETMSTAGATEAERARAAHAIKTVWVIVMENHDWSTIRGNPSAPYINGTLLVQGAHAENYTSPFGIHPSEPNYIWMEAGDDLSILDNDDPAWNYRTTKNHLTRHLERANVSWKSYPEAITPGLCPIASSGRYAAKHHPMVFFDDVTEGRNPHSPHCLAHIRPYEELAGDLVTGAIGRFNFITPDLCNDMHDNFGCASFDRVANGDAWLSREVPKILASRAFREGGALFITWDESEGSNVAPIGLIALSPFAKPGYASHLPFTHSSLVRTIQDVFALRPYMRDAANVLALNDLFVSYP